MCLYFYLSIAANYVFTIDNNSSVRKGLVRLLRVAGFFRKPVDGTALLDSIKWTLKVSLHEK
jgi:FixJ family two-component response regulator